MFGLYIEERSPVTKRNCDWRMIVVFSHQIDSFMVFGSRRSVVVDQSEKYPDVRFAFEDAKGLINFIKCGTLNAFNVFTVELFSFTEALNFNTTTFTELYHSKRTDLCAYDDISLKTAIDSLKKFMKMSKKQICAI